MHRANDKVFCDTEKQTYQSLEHYNIGGNLFDIELNILRKVISLFFR